MKIYYLVKARPVCIAILLAMSLSPVWAINKCTDSNGKVNFSDLPCPENSIASKPVIKPSSGGHAVDDVVMAASIAASNGDLEGMKRTDVKTESYDKLPAGKQRDQMIAFLKYAAPVQVVIVSRNISADGQTATVKATGKYRNMATELLEPTKGLIQLQRVNGSWKISESAWSPDKW
jgi:Domain of unknown function (DUF4124)